MKTVGMMNKMKMMNNTSGKMMILLLMTFLSSCKINSQVDFNQTVGRSPAFSDETKEKAIAACTKMKRNEHAWKAKDIKAYCKEQWRGYIDFIEGDKDE